MKNFVYFLIAGFAIVTLQAITVEAQVGAPPMGAPGGPPTMGGAPGGPPPAGGAPAGEPDLDAMSDAELEALFADAPEGDAAPQAPGTAPMGAPGTPPMGAPPMGAPGGPPMGAPPVR